MLDNDYNFKQAIADSEPLGLTQDEKLMGVEEGEREVNEVTGSLR